jgi:hypothetical protein
MWPLLIGALVAAGGIFAVRKLQQRQQQPPPVEQFDIPPGVQADEALSSLLLTSGMVPSGPSRVVQREGAQQGTGKLIATLRAPDARIAFDMSSSSDSWRGSRLANLYSNGEIVGFDRANDIAMERVKTCGAPPMRGMWHLDLPHKIHFIPVTSSSQADLIKALPIIPQNPSAVPGAAATLDLRHGATRGSAYNPWDVREGGGHKSSVTDEINLPAGRYLMVAEPQATQSSRYCAPRGWWKFTLTGPRLKSTSYMKDHCTDWWTKFYRKIGVTTLGDYAKEIEVRANQTVSVSLRPRAWLRITNRSHFQNIRSKHIDNMCELGILVRFWEG